MPIESSFSTIADLNASYPTGTDYRKDGDNHLRGIKQAIKQTFANVTAAVTTSDEDLNYITGIAADPVGFGEALLPPGIICMWGGALASIPTGWLLCDGTNGTPNLADRFILGTTTGAPAAVGSSHTATVAEGGAHTHGSGVSGSTALTADQIPNHGHSYSHVTATQTSAQGEAAGGLLTGPGTTSVHTPYTGTASSASGQQIGGSAAGGTGHTHTIATSETHTHTVDLRGKYYLMAFIQKGA
jgi:hypothetical protein